VRAFLASLGVVDYGIFVMFGVMIWLVVS